MSKSQGPSGRRTRLTSPYLLGREHLGAGGGALDADIKVGLEGASTLAGLDVVVLTGHLNEALPRVSETH